MVVYQHLWIMLTIIGPNKATDHGFTAMDHDNLCWCAYKLLGRCRIRTNKITIMTEALYGWQLVRIRTSRLLSKLFANCPLLKNQIIKLGSVWELREFVSERQSSDGPLSDNSKWEEVKLFTIDIQLIRQIYEIFSFYTSNAPTIVHFYVCFQTIKLYHRSQLMSTNHKFLARWCSLFVSMRRKNRKKAEMQTIRSCISKYPVNHFHLCTKKYLLLLFAILKEWFFAHTLWGNDTALQGGMELK